MDPDQKNKAIVLGVLVLSLPVLLWWFVIRKTPEELAMEQAVAAAQAEGLIVAAAGAPIQSVFEQNPVDINELFSRIQEVSFRYADVRTQRDPMLPVSGEQINLLAGRGGGVSGDDEPVVYVAQRLEVTGIIWDSNDPYAVINDGNVDNIVDVGFKYTIYDDRVRVKSIGEDHVVVEVILSDGEAQEFVKELKEQ